MKKAFKISVYSLILCGIIALAICYIVIPERTKEAMDIVIDYVNKPLGIVCGTTITVGLVAFVIFKLVMSAHRKSLEEKYNSAVLTCEKEKEEAKAYYASALKEKEQVQEMLSAYDDRLNSQQNQILLVCQTIPNKKVNELANKYAEQSETQKQEIKEKLEKVNNDFVGAMEEKTTLKDVIAQFEELRKLVKEYGERKETTHD